MRTQSQNYIIAVILTSLVVIGALSSSTGQSDTTTHQLDTILHLKYADQIISHYGYTTDSAYFADTSNLFRIIPGYHKVYRKDSTLYMKGSWEVSPEKLITRQDSFFYYHKNGNIRDEGEYKYGVRVGKWNHYHKNGILFYTQDHNSLQRTYYTKEGRIRAQGNMQDRNYKDQLFSYRNLTFHQGMWKFYGFDEKCACKGLVVQDAKVNSWTYYSINRKDKIKRDYTHPKKHQNYNFLQSCLWR